jgi:hypothetical protein
MTRNRGNASARRKRAVFFAALALAGTFGFSGCAYVPFMKRDVPRPGRTTLSSPLVVLPAQTIGNYLVVEAKWDRSGPYRFVIDTGSTVTLVTPELAQRYPGTAPATPPPPVPVQSAGGQTILLPQATMRRLQLDNARFDNVPVLLYDCAALSAHLGVKIDGILGFPLFRQTLLTIDYPRSRVLLVPSFNAPLQPGNAVAFNNTNKKPLIPIRLGETSFIALVDSGSDATLRLNPLGLNPHYVAPPRPGGVVATLTGDNARQVARLSDSLNVANYSLPQPVVELTDELSAIGGGILRHFVVTFDQERSRVIFYRELPEPISFPPMRSVGLSFTKTPAYWRVAGVILPPPAASPGSGANPPVAAVQVGDLVTRINGEPVTKWDLARYERLVATASDIRFTFLNGPVEVESTLPVFNLVP